MAAVIEWVLGNMSLAAFLVSVVVGVTIWLWGGAIDHSRQRIIADNVAPGNARSWFWLDILGPMGLLIAHATSRKK